MTAVGIQDQAVILVADKNMEQAVAGVCSRPDAIGVSAFGHRIVVHPNRDPGCLLEGVEFLSMFQSQFAHALIMFDRIGCGRESQSRDQLEQELERGLSISGWETRAAAVVIDPELEAWVWSDSPHVDRILGWEGRQPTLRQWLMSRRWLAADATKPLKPKEAMEDALHAVRIPRSAALYRQLAQTVSLARCSDASFLKFKTTLQTWFAA